jgi:hypothetical protein
VDHGRACKENGFGLADHGLRGFVHSINLRSRRKSPR